MTLEYSEQQGLFHFNFDEKKGNHPGWTVLKKMKEKDAIEFTESIYEMQKMVQPISFSSLVSIKLQLNSFLSKKAKADYEKQPSINKLKFRYQEEQRYCKDQLKGLRIAIDEWTEEEDDWELQNYITKEADIYIRSLEVRGAIEAINKIIVNQKKESKTI